MRTAEAGSRVRRRTAGFAAGAALLAAAGCVADNAPGHPPAAARRPSPPAATAATADAPTAPVPSALPRGGRTIFPRYRVVAYYGSVGGPALGVLGAGTPESAARRVAAVAAAYATSGRVAQPAMELIATVATAGPGAGGSYSQPIPAAAIEEYCAVARRHRMLMILDVQPGREDFLTQVRRLRRWLVRPDVGIALDPEWKLGPGERPLHRVGSTTAAVVNEVSAYVAGLVRQYALPEKLFLVHQFQVRMVRERSAVVPRPGLAMVFHVDGQGSVRQKLATYRALRIGRPFHLGFKLFYRKDPVLMSPAAVLALRPQPELITYQ